MLKSEDSVKSDTLPIEEVVMPEDNVSDLKDVVDAINKLCETMKTSNHEEQFEETAEVTEPIDFVTANTNYVTDVVHPVEVVTRTVDTWIEVENVKTTTEADETPVAAEECKKVNSEETVSDVTETEVYSNPFKVEHSERWSDTSQTSVPGHDDVTVTCDGPPSEMYYTASSEASLVSDTDVERPVEEVREEKKQCVVAGHVAAMRERFESLTRTNTPCPDLARSMSPSLDVFRNITPSPDRLG